MKVPTVYSIPVFDRILLYMKPYGFESKLFKMKLLCNAHCNE